MSPFERIAAEYARHPKEEPFENYVRFHLRHGFVFSRPDFFCMGRPVVRSAPASAIRDPGALFPSELCDAWYIFAAAGNTARIWQIVPWPLPFIGWARLADPLAELTFVEAERLKRLCPPDLSSLQ